MGGGSEGNAYFAYVVRGWGVQRQNAYIAYVKNQNFYSPEKWPLSQGVSLYDTCTLPYTYRFSVQSNLIFVC